MTLGGNAIRQVCEEVLGLWELEIKLITHKTQKYNLLLQEAGGDRWTPPLPNNTLLSKPLHHTHR